MTPRNPSLIITRHLEKNDEMLYVVVERVYGPDIEGELYRLRAHYHPVGSRRTADLSNVLWRDETGNRYYLRLEYIKFLLGKRDEGWTSTSANLVATVPEGADFWHLDTL
jgi:hypothetical protein